MCIWVSVIQNKTSYSSRAGCSEKTTTDLCEKKTVRTDDIGPVGCIFVNFDKYTYQPHGTIAVQNEIKFHQQKRERAYLYMQQLPCRTSLIHSCASLQFLEAEILHNCFLSQLFYSQFDSKKYEDSIVFNSVSRHDDVYMMT